MADYILLEFCGDNRAYLSGAISCIGLHGRSKKYELPVNF